MKWLHNVLPQLGLFIGALVLHRNFGHTAGKEAAINIAPGAQVLISMLFLAAHVNKNTENEFQQMLWRILLVYHTFILSVCVGTIDGSTGTVVWEILIGGTLVVFNLAAYDLNNSGNRVKPRQGLLM